MWQNILLGGDVLSIDEQIERLEELQRELLLTGLAYDAADIGITASKEETKELIRFYELEIMALKEKKKLLADLAGKTGLGKAGAAPEEITPLAGLSDRELNEQALAELEKRREEREPLFDVESVGLHGEGFAFGYTITDLNGVPLEDGWYGQLLHV